MPNKENLFIPQPPQKKLIYLKTFKTLIVQAVDITFSLYRARSTAFNSSAVSAVPSALDMGERSRGLLDPEVAMAKAAAALEVLLLHTETINES